MWPQLGVSCHMRLAFKITSISACTRSTEKVVSFSSIQCLKCMCAVGTLTAWNMYISIHIMYVDEYDVLTF